MQQIMDPALLSITPSSAPKECRGFARLRDQTAFKNAVDTQLVSSFVRAKRQQEGLQVPSPLGFTWRNTGTVRYGTE